MGFIDATLTGIFAARIASRLFEIERTRRKTMSPAEAAGYFFSAAFPFIGESSFVLPMNRDDMAERAGGVMRQWLQKGDMREAHFLLALKQLTNI